MAKSVEFKTVDGITLRGNLFLAPPQPDGTPIVITTQGLTLLKEHFLPNWGAKFVEVGDSVLIYDHRGWGSSDKSHENGINPMQQAEDYHDAVADARLLSEIDPSRITIWGIGHSGGASIIAAGDDPHMKAVILMMPFFSGVWDATNWPEGIKSLVHDERRSIVTETPRPAPDYLKSWDSSLKRRPVATEVALHSMAKFLTSLPEMLDSFLTRLEPPGTPASRSRVSTTFPKSNPRTTFTKYRRGQCSIWLQPSTPLAGRWRHKRLHSRGLESLSSLFSWTRTIFPITKGLYSMQICYPLSILPALQRRAKSYEAFRSSGLRLKSNDFEINGRSTK